jgi:NAD(P)-dependent dehydrogenase (short-subunit alcohol dehydrogenase family)
VIDETQDAAGPVVLVLNAGSDAGFRIARDLLQGGHRVAISSRRTTDLARIVHGYPSSQVLAVAADPDDPTQMSRLLARVRCFAKTSSVPTGRTPSHLQPSST